MANPDSQRRCVFVGNIPYDATEEQLVQICEEVGPVVSFRLVTDRETGKPKGYGFCEYKDEETALSARRNLQGYEINGRQLRVDFAENDKNADKNREQGRGGPGMVADPQRLGGPTALGNSSLHQPIGHAVATTAATVMAGALGAAQMGSSLTQTGLPNQFGSGIDPLSLYLSKMSRSQLYEIISDMKAIATQNKEQARQILHTIPNLPKAIFQAQLMLGLVTPQMLQTPNIRQSSVPPPHSILPDSHRNQQLAVRTLPGGIPPPHSSLAPQTQPQVQLPQSAENNILQHGRLPIHSGVQAIRPQGNLSATLPIQVGTSTSSSLKQQMHHPLLPQAGLVPSANLAYTSQPAAPNAAFQPSPATEKLFQPSSSALSTPLDNIIKGRLETQIVANNSAWVNKTIPTSGLAERARAPNDCIDAMNHRPSKLSKLNDGRSSYSPAELNVGTLVTRPSRSASLSGNQISGTEEASSSEKHALQITPDVESALLQQVMSLTPEQLNSLPPDQRQQVLQLQRMLRQPT
ncbi:PREDICTED: cleavage stimulating factor 64 isoform X2 [Ipomoea nil]|uniref:cleavage stimulating factor 64 isoform X2 n=1 Tax=Ipomoea nil TaxID=35883 RepID=UPI0009017867|nr:PREDICTED: cleavage stimulating factor 64 isoform X2 [Ipomoea nil]